MSKSACRAERPGMAYSQLLYAVDILGALESKPVISLKSLKSIDQEICDKIKSEMEGKESFLN